MQPLNDWYVTQTGSLQVNEEAVPPTYPERLPAVPATERPRNSSSNHRLIPPTSSRDSALTPWSRNVSCACQLPELVIRRQKQSNPKTACSINITWLPHSVIVMSRLPCQLAHLHRVGSSCLSGSGLNTPRNGRWGLVLHESRLCC
jgi:hypothetical protein